MSDHDSMAAPPPLIEGNRRDQHTFHALYEAMPPGTRAELIDGVVWMPDSFRSGHGMAKQPVIVWLDYYREQTLGLQVAANVSTVLGPRSELQPDALLYIPTEFGGQTLIEKEWLCGPPELVAEGSRSQC